MSAIRGLEPVVNLAQLQIRAGQGDDGRHHLLALYEAVSTGTLVQLGNITVPANLTRTPEGRQEVRAWLWRVLLADGTRTLTTAGRWNEALAHLQQHRGIGKKMLDGRQVAVVAALVMGDTASATKILEDTSPGDPWEQTVTACLIALCRRTADEPVGPALAALTDEYAKTPLELGMTVFTTRLGLALLDLADSAEEPSAHRLIEELHRRTLTLRDGYAARDCLAHPSFSTLATAPQHQSCRDLITSCALGAGRLPQALHDQLNAALRTSNRTIRASVTR